MADIFSMESKIKEIIDSLKGLCSQNGLSNQAEEERIITSVFLYKFLNDKFMYHLGQRKLVRVLKKYLPMKMMSWMLFMMPTPVMCHLNMKIPYNH